MALAQSPFRVLGRVSRLGLPMTGAGDAELVSGLRISAGFFDTLGVPMQLRRNFIEQEEHPDTRRVIILSRWLLENEIRGKSQCHRPEYDPGRNSLQDRRRSTPKVPDAGVSFRRYDRCFWTARVAVESTDFFDDVIAERMADTSWGDET
jgi:hypothetical protein